jgi:Retrotransposon gag protein
MSGTDAAMGAAGPARSTRARSRGAGGIAAAASPAPSPVRRAPAGRSTKKGKAKPSAEGEAEGEQADTPARGRTLEVLNVDTAGAGTARSQTGAYGAAGLDAAALTMDLLKRLDDANAKAAEAEARARAAEQQALRVSAAAASSSSGGSRASLDSQPAAAPGTQAHGSTPRATDLAEYKGEAGAVLDAWLADLRAVADFHRLTPARTVEFGVYRLKGTARSWWTGKLTDGERAAINDLPKLAAGLRARFQPITTEDTARAQLCAIVQGSRSVDAYIAEFEALSERVPSMSEPDRVFHFRRGVRADIADKLRDDGVESLARAIEVAARRGHTSAVSAGGRGYGGASGTHPSRLHQMESADDPEHTPAPVRPSASSGEIEQLRHELYALRQQMAPSDENEFMGLGAKTQTKRGYGASAQQQRGGRGGGRGRGGPGAAPRPPLVIPGVHPHELQRRRDNGLCYRCAEPGHNGIACPNSIRPSN